MDQEAGSRGARNNAVFSSKNQNSNFFSRHLHGDLNLNEIKKRIAAAACKSRDESNESN